MRNSTRLTLATVLAGLLCSLSVMAAAPAYRITVEIDPTGSGTVELDPQKDSYQKNNIVTLLAVPATGKRFDGWGGDLGGSQNPATLRVSTNHTVIARFADDSGGGGGGGGGDPPPPPADDLPTQGLVVGYFAQWNIYRRGYLPKHVATSGAVQQLNVMNYAFAAPDANLRCASLDTFADWGKRFDASESVDGVADTVAQPLKGNFNQILKLKKLNPNLRVLISLGGWTQSYRFSDAALPGNREAFVDSCIDMFVKGNVAPGVSAAGVFDGIDVDWEYPGSCGATCDFRPEDRGNFVALLALFRAKLDALGAAQGGRRYLLTIAAPAGATHYAPLDLAGVAAHVDWINLMSYDFHGAWESAGPTNHISALFRSACEPMDGDWSDKAVQAYLAAGVPPSKLLLGLPFYGRGWRTAAVGDGFCRPATGVPRGTYEKGVDDYEVLAARLATDFRDEATGTHWTFDGSQFWSYDDSQSAAWKADYANCRQLRGAMFWELSGDDPGGSLLGALQARLRDTTSGCQPGWPVPGAAGAGE